MKSNLKTDLSLAMCIPTQVICNGLLFGSNASDRVMTLAMWWLSKGKFVYNFQDYAHEGCKGPGLQ